MQRATIGGDSERPNASAALARLPGLAALLARTPANVLLDGCFVAALACYGLFSYPFPLSPGFMEALIGAP